MLCFFSASLDSYVGNYTEKLKYTPAKVSSSRHFALGSQVHLSVIAFIFMLYTKCITNTITL